MKRWGRPDDVAGAMIYADEKGGTVSYEHVFAKIELCRKHYGEVGLGANYANQFVRCGVRGEG
jgi:2,4'-dihydroxyacetophenone dioxygenase